MTKFYVGNYQTKGCFFKGGSAYFGTGGNAEDRAKVSLSGEKKRIWCNENAPSTSQKPTRAPTAPPPTRAPTAQPTGASRSRSACLDEQECDRRRQDLGIARYKVGDHPTKGCFSKGETVYWGTGGTDDDKSDSPLSGEKQRIWCDIQTRATAHCIDVHVHTGELRGGRAGFELSTKPRDGSAPQKMWEFPVGSLESEREYAKRVCEVPDGTYTLTVVGRSSYSARISGQEVLFGSNSWRKTNSHELLVGYTPVLSGNEKAWVDEHNTRREAFHKKHNEEYRPLRWSSELAQHASDWADTMVPSCEFAREPKLEEGENIAFNKYNISPRSSDSRGTEVPANILARWSDMKADHGYPENQSLAQVMWRATRYVGCATKVAENANGSYCHVSICRYSRPGNCGMSAENWLAKTLDEHSLCGRACPGEGCH